MRYRSEHKQQTRRLIVDEASRSFRADGTAGTSIADVMARAGLTHGGFYAHFANKEALLADACSDALDAAAESLFGETAGGSPEERLRRAIGVYLSRTHRDAPAT